MNQDHDQQFRQWADNAIRSGQFVQSAPARLAAISGDAGFRKYFRVVDSSPAVLAVDAPPATEKNHAFVHVARLLRQYGVHAPQIMAVDYDNGFLLVEDLGDIMYWPLLQQIQRDAGPAMANLALPSLYVDAETSLLRMQHIPVSEAGLPPYDEAKLQQEMALFPEWFVQKLLSCRINASQQQMLVTLFQRLTDSALEQPQVVVHRDFHCRNLVKTASNNPGVIDFQDAVTGAITYDLVSLYRDCYIAWPPALVTRWALDYYSRLLAGKLVPAVSEELFLRWFDWMGLQRHIKVLGIFARLYLRDNKAGYLKDLPLVIHYTLSVAKQYPEFSTFVAWFEQELLPEARRSSWYREVST